MRTFAAAVTTSFGSSTNRPGQPDLLFAAIFSAANAASARLREPSAFSYLPCARNRLAKLFRLWPTSG